MNAARALPVAMTAANDTAAIIKVDTANARATFAPGSSVVTFVATIDAPGKACHGMSMDTHVGPRGKRDAAKMYKWALVHSARVARMSQAEFRDEMAIFGIRLD